MKTIIMLQLIKITVPANLLQAQALKNLAIIKVTKLTIVSLNHHLKAQVQAHQIQFRTQTTTKLAKT